MVKKCKDSLEDIFCCCKNFFSSRFWIQLERVIERQLWKKIKALKVTVTNWSG